MKLEVKQSIEQIQHGIVPKGYKKTSIAVIPKEWEVIHFKEMFSRQTRRNSEGNTNVLTISARYGLISQEDFFGKGIASEDKSNYFLLYKGDFAYNKSYSNGYPYGAIKVLDKYEKGIVSPLYICFSAVKENGCPEYYVQYFESSLLNHEINAFAQEGARNHGLLNISVDDFFNSRILYPPITEQRKIAEILTTQDKLIELQQAKVDELKKLKKAFLNKMFPKNGCNVPEVRFPGFTEAWEQRRASTLFVATADKGHPNLPVLSATQDRGMIKRDENNINIFHDKKNEEGYKRVVPGQFVIHLRSFQGGFAHSAIEGITSPAYTVFGFKEPTEHSDIFWKYVFTSTEFIRRLETVTYGIRDGRSISYDEFLTMNFMVPAVKEQTQIAEFLTHLDNLIALHQRKLDEVKKYKKSLMQLLLTGIVRVKI